jgi:hypothetical protein
MEFLIMFIEMAVPNTQGGQANTSGQYFESMVRNALLHRGYVELPRTAAPVSEPYFMTQKKGGFLSVYDKELTVDFFAFHPVKFPSGLVIECKYQGTSGSVDEKFPYTVLSLKNMPCPSVLLMEGGGANPKARDWVMRQKDTTFTPFDGISSFIRAVNSGLL